MNHEQMRAILVPAFRRVIGRDGTTSELQCLQAIASLESGYGQYWKPPGDKSKNLGALQAGSSWRGKTYSYTDTTPQTDGSSKPYVTQFRFYDTWEDAADDLVRAVYRSLGRDNETLPAATAGLSLRFSASLFATRDPAVKAAVRDKYGALPTGYYEGRGKTAEERIANHHRSVVASIRAQALALDEPLPADIEAEPIKPELLRLGSHGSAVATLQAELNRHHVTPPLKVDGDFGDATRENVVKFQRRAKLVADGIVGVRTWDALTASTQ